MITATEAAKKIYKKHKLSEINGCLDFGNFYVFLLRPFYAKEEQRVESGTQFPAIDKRTGKEFYYDITSDPDAYLNAKKVKI